MNIQGLKQIDEYRWVPLEKPNSVMMYGSKELIAAMDDKVRQQITNVASLPGLVGAAMTMPDAHWGYGFPIGGVAASACHGAGRQMSRTQALKQWQGKALINELARQSIYIRSHSMRGIAEEAPGAYKDVDKVVEITEFAGLARRVAFLKPVACVKG